VSWDDASVDWETFDLVVIRSTWDSVDRPEEYLAWVSAVSGKTRLENPADVVAWNLDKHYLAELNAAGITVVPTTWIEPPDADGWRVPGGGFVVKPAVSAGGRETARYDEANAGEAEVHIERLLEAGCSVMVQPYVAAVDAVGEVKVVFIDGRFSHAVRVGPLLEPGAGVMDKPWDKPVSVEATEPSPDQLRLAEAAVGYLNERFGAVPLYARADIVDGGGPMIGEVELIDPVLSLWAKDTAAPALAAAIAARVSGRGARAARGR